MFNYFNEEMGVRTDLLYGKIVLHAVLGLLGPILVFGSTVPFINLKN